MKICTECLIEKENNCFSPNNKCKDGLQGSCKECKNKYNKEHRRTKNGLIAKIYDGQRSRSKRRYHNMPSYTNLELKNWLFSQPNFEKLYNNRVESGYNKDLTPSVDRKDDYKGYSFNNIQLMTWGENKRKGELDIKNGINNKTSKAVIGNNKITGEVIEFHSINEARRKTSISSGDISQCCLGKSKSAGGYVWKFKKHLQ